MYNRYKSLFRLSPHFLIINMVKGAAQRSNKPIIICVTFFSRHLNMTIFQKKRNKKNADLSIAATSSKIDYF